MFGEAKSQNSVVGATKQHTDAKKRHTEDFTVTLLLLYRLYSILILVFEDAYLMIVT